MASNSLSWQTAWDNAQPALETVKSRLASLTPSAPRVVRVGQLDAELLDQELVALLRQPLLSALAMLKSSWAANFDLEIALVIQTVLYKYSIWDSGATYGAKLQDLRFERPPRLSGRSHTPSGLLRRSLLAHAVLTVLAPYLHSRIRMYGLSKSWPDAPRLDVRRKAWDVLLQLETLHATSALVGFIAFLWDGKYRTLADRLIGLKLVPARRIVTRNVNYEFMNKQMVWHAFTEFLLFILPLINLRIVRRRLARGLQKVSSLVSWTTRNVFSISHSPASGDGGTLKAAGSHRSRAGKYASLPIGSCAICAEDSNPSSGSPGQAQILPFPVPETSTSQPNHPSAKGDGADENTPPQHPINVPYTTSCGHTYCYYCLTTRMMQAADFGDVGWECLRCTDVVVSARRLEEEVATFEGSDEWSSDSSDTSDRLEERRPPPE